MATYVYVCDTCETESEEWFPIGTARRTRRCECGGRMNLAVGRGMYIAADALPNKKHGVRAANAREKRWNVDMPAYKRMRSRGLQPPSIDGAGRLEDVVGDQTDIDHRQIIPADERKRRSVKERIMEVKESFTGTPPTKVAS